MAALHGSADVIDDAEHEFETFAQEFIKLDDWHEVTFSEHQELLPMNIMNITGIESDDESLGTMPWTPPMQPPSSRPIPCDRGQFSRSQKLANRSQQTTPGNLFYHSNQTLANSNADLSAQTESYNVVYAVL